MTIVAPWGVWQCSDHRLVYLKRRPNRQWQVDRTDDYSIKHVALRCPDGAALITYAGLGGINDVDLSDWLRRQVRNENRTVDGMLIRLREAATKDLAGPAKDNDIAHAFVAGAFLQRRPWWAAITNQPGPANSPILDQFVTFAEPADNPPRRLVAGYGREAISAEDWALLDRIRTVGRSGRRTTLRSSRTFTSGQSNRSTQLVTGSARHARRCSCRPFSATPRRAPA